MRCGWVVAILCLGCSTSATNDQQNSSGGTDAGGTDGGGAGGTSAGGSGGATGATGGTAGATGGTAGTGGTEDSGTGGTLCTTAAVVINEISTTGVNTDTDEFIELYNPMSSAFNLDGFQIQIAGPSGTPVTAWLGDPTDEILAGGFFVIGGVTFTLPANALLSSGQTIPADGGVALLDQSTILDSVAYGSVDTGHPFLEGAPANNDGPDGTSMVRLPDGEDCNDNATDFGIASRTPGSNNQP